MADPYDVIVIGSGPGGYLAAILAAQRKLRVVCIEKERLGGVCLNWGCIPSKALLRAAEQYVFMKEEAAAFGLSCENVGHDWAKVVGRSRKIADQSERGVRFLFKKYGVEVVAGTAELSAPGSVTVTQSSGSVTLEGKHIILATGARARVFPGMEVDGERVMTYRNAIASLTQPESVIVLGSGAIGLEFAYFYNSFGTRVTLVEGADRVCPLEDADVSAEVGKSFKKAGVDVLTGALCQSIVREGDGVVAKLKDGRELRASHALIAVGVTPNIEGIGLEKLGVATEAGHVKVDKSYRTNVPGVYAIGDLCGPPALAHTAYAEAHVCVARIAGEHSPDVDYGNMPAATYCQPQIASVGLTEAAARAQGLEFTVGKFPLSANGKARAIGASEGFVKVLVGKKHGEILGAHLVGHDVSELLANFVMARGAEVTAEHFLHTVHAHPTVGEAMFEAVAEAVGKGAHL
ncbi:dihydrolipoyl dehydrogenase [Deltaproteobacteria bacterium]|nr:dihydrolipoyl dehydrogenase [Deltaproteobacteria bacterium]